jgi:flavin-dependent dehydrogenase
MAPLVEYAAENGAVYHYHTTAKQLVRNGNGRVEAVIAEGADGCFRKFLARQ